LNNQFMALILPPLADVVRPPVRILFVGINPGVRSGTIGHHFAGYSNRFWKLLYEARLTPQRLRAEQDGGLPEFGLGITNVIPRTTPGIDSLRPEEYAAGERVLRRKVRRWQPDIVAFVGVTLYRVVFRRRAGERIALGPQPERFEGARVFVLPNPSGRNANFSYSEMLAAFRRLRRFDSALQSRDAVASADSDRVGRSRVSARGRPRPAKRRRVR
jgi:TDG/mug DNA glycosylase family protein